VKKATYGKLLSFADQLLL